uniref:Uncharacterized protein n=1 Tax=Arundo donax TaxID=35708 RepID=A0A0A8XVD8_ARUDO
MPIGLWGNTVLDLVIELRALYLDCLFCMRMRNR